MSNVPDARGVFVRAMNEGRDKSTGDVDGNRSVGNYQDDQFEKHNHDVSYTNGQFAHSAGGMGIQSNEGHQVQYNYLNISVGERGGNETRPRNVTSYLYIKIN